MARTADPGLAERRRRQIMEAALACFRRRGFHQSSMHEICAEAAMSAGAVYRYFPSKTDIIAAIAVEDGCAWQQRFDDVEDVAGVIDRFGDFAKSFVGEILKRGDAPLMGDVIAEALRDAGLAKRLRANLGPLRAKLRRLLSEGQRRGEVDKALDPERAVRLIIATVDGVCMRALLDWPEAQKNVGADVRVVLTKLLRPPGETKWRAHGAGRTAARKEHAE